MMPAPSVDQLRGDSVSRFGISGETQAWRWSRSLPSRLEIGATSALFSGV